MNTNGAVGFRGDPRDRPTHMGRAAWVMTHRWRSGQAWLNPTPPVSPSSFSTTPIRSSYNPGQTSNPERARPDGDPRCRAEFPCLPDGALQLGSRPEHRALAGVDRDRAPGLRVTALSSGPIDHLERPETANRHFIAVSERRLNGGENRSHCFRRGCFVLTGSRGHFSNEILLAHVYKSPL